MLIESKMNKSFWNEAVLTAVYIYNRSSREAINERIPYELWLNRKPNISHLRVFGCNTYVRIPKNYRDKYDTTYLVWKIDWVHGKFIQSME